MHNKLIINFYEIDNHCLLLITYYSLQIKINRRAAVAKYRLDYER